MTGMNGDGGVGCAAELSGVQHLHGDRVERRQWGCGLPGVAFPGQEDKDVRLKKGSDNQNVLGGGAGGFDTSPVIVGQRYSPKGHYCRVRQVSFVSVNLLRLGMLMASDSLIVGVPGVVTTPGVVIVGGVPFMGGISRTLCSN